jgi:hypothetical protein
VFRFRVGLGRYPSLFVLVRDICGYEGLASYMIGGSGRTALEAGLDDVHHIPARELTTAAPTSPPWATYRV